VRLSSAAGRLDYADQRFYASAYARFNTPDPYQASGSTGNPISLNLYSYTLGDPVNRSDPNGLDSSSPPQPDPENWQSAPPPDDFEGWGGPVVVTQNCGYVQISIYIPVPESCWGAPIVTVATTSPPPQCDVELNTRPVYASAGIGTHSYLEVWGSTGGEDTLEGGPTNGGLLNTFTPGVLKSFDTPDGFAYTDDLPADQGTINPISCTQADALIADDRKFSTTLTYSFAGLFGPNSNSFLHWLITTGGLSSLYPSAPFGAFGWNNPVQPVSRPPRVGR
jgi:RHS repeat-associated protein